MGELNKRLAETTQPLELADLLEAGVEVADAASQGIKLYRESRDADTAEAMKKELDDLDIEKVKGKEKPVSF